MQLTEVSLLNSSVVKLLPENLPSISPTHGIANVTIAESDDPYGLFQLHVDGVINGTTFTVAEPPENQLRPIDFKIVRTKGTVFALVIRHLY